MNPGHFVFWGVFSHLLIKASLEEAKPKKTDRSGLAWWDPEPAWLTEPVGPSFLGSPIGPTAPQRPVGPPAPLVDQGRPPAPLVDQGRPPASLVDQGRPPAPLVDQGRPPAPLVDQGRLPAPLIQPPETDQVTRGGVHAEDIRCMRSGGSTLLSAMVVPPPELANSRPVFEDASSAPPTDCLMRPMERRRTFQMHVQHFGRCGVRVQPAPDGKEWISVTLRFPAVEGLRSAEDEYVVVMCRPQDRVVATQHSMELRGTASVEGRSVQPKRVFRGGGPRDMSCRVSLMTRGSPDSSGFVREVKSGQAVSVGQELQIRAQVREGDGWNYAMLKDVMVTRVTPGNKFQQFRPLAESNSIEIGEGALYRDQRQPEDGHDVAHLVLNDGCRNPLYRPLAPMHPERDPQRPLTASFAFKAFMFADMTDGEALRITAQVIACADAADCQQSFCDAARGAGKKKRKRRELHPMANFTDDFELIINFNGFSSTSLSSSDISVHPSPFFDCRLVVASVGAAAVFLCVATTTAAAIALGAGRKRVK
ncbi:hypothetical protein JTE90_001327 [Oedothorax gibbosus]|uniref:ZP domain-containing protein n=1 Tax=Oedothorax gibbosus TaxID=931172 RepID=A0AAV6V0I2_9ARAC|nr:hypothetical protein JTE90_001327 [Oedothorax gibbosus]